MVVGCTQVCKNLKVHRTAGTRARLLSRRDTKLQRDQESKAHVDTRQRISDKNRHGQRSEGRRQLANNRDCKQ